MRILYIPRKVNIVREDTVIFINGNYQGKLYSYDPPTKTLTDLKITVAGGADVAHTQTKLFVGGNIYSITLNPFTCTLERTVSNVSSGSGLYAINNTTLVGDMYRPELSSQALCLYNVSGSSAIITPLFSISAAVGGDILYNPSLDRYIISTGLDWKLTEYSSSGTIIRQLTAPKAELYGLFQYNNILYACFADATIYTVINGVFNYYDTVNIPYGIYGSSQYREVTITL